MPVPPARNMGSVLDEVQRDVRALNSSVLIISKRMKDFARNEKILGRNILVLNKKISILKEQLAKVGAVPVQTQQVTATEPSAKTLELSESLGQTSIALSEALKSLNDLRKQFNELQANMVTKEKFAEVEYLVTSIDPLNFVTREEVKNIVDKKISGKDKKK